jgi:alpha-ketoglutarate-dependent taurine dioxygenase
MGSQRFRITHLSDVGDLPLLIEPRDPGLAITEAFPDIRTCVAENLHSSGGVLFRGFGIEGPSEFHDFAAGFNHPLLAYDFGSTPRSSVIDGIYTSTEYPASQHIPLHNEQSYTREWVMKLWFYCMTPALTGGDTLVADSRQIFRLVRPAIRDRFISKGLMYVRNYGNGLDVPWQKVFNTTEPRKVEAYCAARDIICEWKANGELRTRQLSQVVERHPTTGDEVWFNQAHLFHISGLESSVRELLLDIVGTEDLPRNVYYADNSPIELDILEEIRSVLNETAIRFSWQADDVLLIDNMLTAHGRTPFTGNRKVLVAMSEAHSNLGSGPNNGIPLSRRL